MKPTAAASPATAGFSSGTWLGWRGNHSAWLRLLWLLSAVPHLSAIEPQLPQPHHGLRFTNAVTRWDEALPLGNGLMGALVWGDGQPVRVSLDRTDLWDLRPVPEFYSPEYSFRRMREWHEAGRHDDLVRLYEAPYNRPAPTKIPAGRLELAMDRAAPFAETALDLESALATVRFADGSQLSAFVHAVEPVGMLRFEPAGESKPVPITARVVPPPFAGKVEHSAQGGIGAGDLAQLGYPPPGESRGRDWQAFVQEGADGFRFAVYLAWRQRAGRWEAAWSIGASSTDPDPLPAARRQVERALGRGFASTLRSHRRWWRNYWLRSTLRVPNPVVERQWFLETYKFGAASRRGAPPISLQGPWTADDGQLPPWKGDYHHDLNTQLSYWPCYSGNRLEEGLAYLDWLWDTRSNCLAWTQRFFGLPGLNVPMTGDLRNSQIGGWRQYTHSITTAAWLAHHFYLHWRFSADSVFLRDRAFPYLRDASVFLEAIATERDRDGERTLPLSSSPEIHDNRPEAWFKTITNYDLALLRWLWGATAELATELGRIEDAAHWRGVLSELPEFALGSDRRMLVARDEPLRESHRHFSHLMAIHPLGLIDVADGPDAQAIVRASLADLERLGSDLWCGYSFSWLGNLAARARDGQRAERALEVFSRAFTLRNGFHCNGDQSGNGYSKMTYRPFTLEGNFAMAAGLQEMLLQSHRGAIEVFPVVPEAWRDVAFTTLRAEGAFLISAERRAGSVARVEVFAERGGTLRLRSPWTGELMTRPMRARESLSLSQP